MRIFSQAVAVAAMVLICSLALAAARPARGPGVWLDYWSEGGFTGRDYTGVQVTESGAASLWMYFPQPTETHLQFSPTELAYLRQLTAPLWPLAGQPISTPGVDLPTSTLTLIQGSQQVNLTWVGTQRPELLAFTEFARTLVNQVVLRRALVSGNTQQILYLMRATNPLASVFRQTELRDPLLQVISKWPLPGATDQDNTTIFAGSVALLSQIDTHGQWAGEVMTALSAMTPETRARAVTALSEAAVNAEYGVVPWRFLTPAFVQEYQALAQVPEAQRSESQRTALTYTQTALQTLYNPSVTIAPNVAYDIARAVP